MCALFQTKKLLSVEEEHESLCPLSFLYVNFKKKFLSAFVPINLSLHTSFYFMLFSTVSSFMTTFFLISVLIVLNGFVRFSFVSVYDLIGLLSFF
jgi:hypothetical protein